jgi:hypothetical protein
MRLLVIFLLAFLAGCASAPKPIANISEEQIRTLYEEVAYDMRRGNLRSAAAHYSRDYFLEDSVSFPGNPIKWNLVEYFRQGVGLMNTAKSWTLEYRILSIEINDYGDQAIVVSEHHNIWNLGDSIRETEAIQENTLVIVGGRLLISRTKVIQARLLRG